MESGDALSVKSRAKANLMKDVIKEETPRRILFRAPEIDASCSFEAIFMSAVTIQNSDSCRCTVLSNIAILKEKIGK